MNILMIGDSSRLYMPYIKNYEDILKNIQCNYKVVNWDRFDIDEYNNLRYVDNKIGHKRNLFDYYKYSKYILRLLKQNQFDKIIIFGLPILIFLGRYLQYNYKSNYIIDIRDHHKAAYLNIVKKTISNSNATIISSPMYKSWLPKIGYYICNHNTNVNSFDDIIDRKPNRLGTINIANIGATRDLEANIKLIDSLSNENYVKLIYHGEGEINKLIISYVKEKNISNVLLTGRYKKEEENELYWGSTLINVLRYPDSTNNSTALPNRLYNSVYLGIPMLAYPGTYLSDVILKYDLGLVIKDQNNIKNEIINYLEEFDTNNYQKGRREFLFSTIKENSIFEEYIKSFVV